MRIIHITRPAIATLVILCASASLAWAVSIYDVIELSQQGYSDQEIIKVIRTTRSVFKLSAEDIPRLTNLGVSEVVIRSMLASSPTEPSEPIPAIAFGREKAPHAESSVVDHSIEDRIGDSVSATAVSHSHADSDGYRSRSAPTINSERFSLQFVSEEAAGDHQHVYVTLSNVPLLILRDEGDFQSIVDRGNAVVSNLEEAVRMGDGRFRLLRTNEADLVVFHSANLREVPIISVNRRDVYAYDVRSERRVTADLLASYWAALLDDYWAITFQHRSPSRLVNLHRGDALLLLNNLVNKTADGNAPNLGLAVQQLPREIQSHLERLATAIPDDFDSWSGYVGDSS